MNTKLITALRTAANAIEAGTFAYDWHESGQCNCGVVVCALTGLSADALSKRLDEELGEDRPPVWKKMVGKFCPITGIPNSLIFKELYSYGLTATEISELEYMSNQKVIARLPKRFSEEKHGLFNHKTRQVSEPYHFDDGKDLILYLRTWADILCEQGQDDAIMQGVQEAANA